jgi:hypothetical protein
MKPAPMTEERRRLARELLAQATPGPWAVGTPANPRHLGPGTGYGVHNIYQPETGCDVTGPHAHLHGADAALIAAAPELLAEALDEIERLLHAKEG